MKIPEPASAPAIQTALEANATVRRHGLQPLVILLLLAPLALFSYLCIQLAAGRDAGIDRSILLAFRTPGDLAKPIGPLWLLQSAIDLSALGGFTFIWLFTAATTGFLALVRRWWAMGLLLGAIVGVSLLKPVVKVSFHRARPQIVPNLAEVSNASFPSGHAMISAATYLTIGAMLAQSQPSQGAWILDDPRRHSDVDDRRQPSLSRGSLALRRARWMDTWVGLCPAVLGRRQEVRADHGGRQT